MDKQAKEVRRLGTGMSRAKRDTKRQQWGTYRKEAQKMQHIIKLKNEEYWRNFIEEQGAEDP